jgi:hypothetical protein
VRFSVTSGLYINILTAMSSVKCYARITGIFHKKCAQVKKEELDIEYFVCLSHILTN